MKRGGNLNTSPEFLIVSFVLGLCVGSFCMTIIWGVFDKKLRAAYQDYINSLNEEIAFYKGVSNKLVNERAKSEEERT